MPKTSVLTYYYPGNILFQAMIINSDVLLAPNILDPPWYSWKVALSPHKFTHHPSSCSWIRTFIKYGVMLPFSGITLRTNIMNISELLPDLWWMEEAAYGLNIQCLKTSVRKQRYIIFLSWKEDLYKKTYVYIYIYLKCVTCVKYKIVWFNMCVRLGSILASAYTFRNM
jgi:hypothetical protein